MKNPARVILHTEQQILRVQRRIWALQLLFWIAVGAAVLAAAAKLALIGAMAKAAERFDWDDVVDCARFCQEAFARRAEAGVR